MGVIKEEGLDWKALYRATVSEEPTTALDDVILKAAGRRTAQVRSMRRGVLVLALAGTAIWPLWHLQPGRLPQTTMATDVGRQEGATRYYLMNVAVPRETGPGLEELHQ
jgi:ferric-dicitrate binding protein FerR (iron transport regulator)